MTKYSPGFFNAQTKPKDTLRRGVRYMLKNLSSREIPPGYKVIAGKLYPRASRLCLSPEEMTAISALLKLGSPGR